MRFKNYILIILCTFVMLSFPVIAGASAVPWSAEQYTATAQTNTDNGPPLPAAANWSGSGFLSSNNAGSTIASDYMSVNVRSHNLDYYVYASAKFLGSYIVEDTTPLFQFTYDGNYTSVNPGFISGHYAWLRVNDVTTSTMLYEDFSLLLDSGVNTIEVSTIAGHEIEIDFGVLVEASRNFDSQTESATLNYSMAVVPEPVSSTLFIIGGATFGFRRFRSKFKR